MEWDDPHDKNPDNESEQSSEYEGENIQLRYFIFYFLSILYSISTVQKIKPNLPTQFQ